MNSALDERVGSESRLSAPEFDLLREVIQTHSGISLNDTKRALVEARLARRVRATAAGSFRDYARWVSGLPSSDDEIVELLNCMTTNKTSFFREAHHFELLERVIVPELVERAKVTGEKRLRIWSAGCSTGQEPYSIAMCVRRALGAATDWDVRILASDLDTRVLDVASEGVYARDEIEGVPDGLRAQSFMSVARDVVRVVPEVRDLVTFRRINLADDVWPIRAKFDVIFCRNVVIYFERHTQRAVYDRIARLLAPEAYLLAGHSENLYWMADLFHPVGATAYKPAGSTAASTLASVEPLTKQVSIQAGGVHAASEPTWIRTVLGSCIAVCLHDPVARVGGMNHFVLPDGADDVTPARFGTHAMDALIDAVTKLGGQRDRLQAKIFGGANLVTSLAGRSSVADRNVAFIEEFLASKGIAVLARKVGGVHALVVHYEPTLGRARVRVVDGPHARESDEVRPTSRHRSHVSESTVE